MHDLSPIIRYKKTLHYAERAHCKSPETANVLPRLEGVVVRQEWVVSIEAAILERKPQEAVALINRNDPEEEITQIGLVYLAALRAGDEKLAEQQWKALLAALPKQGRDERRLNAMLTNGQPMNTDLVRRLPIDARQKRVLMAAIARRHAEAKDLLDLARRLNFHRDATSLCLQLVLD